MTNTVSDVHAGAAFARIRALLWTLPAADEAMAAAARKRPRPKSTVCVAYKGPPT